MGYCCGKFGAEEATIDSTLRKEFNELTIRQTKVVILEAAYPIQAPLGRAHP